MCLYISESVVESCVVWPGMSVVAVSSATVMSITYGW